MLEERRPVLIACVFVSTGGNGQQLLADKLTVDSPLCLVSKNVEKARQNYYQSVA